MQSELLQRLKENTEEEKRILSGGALEKDIYSRRGKFVISDDLLPEGGKPISIRPHTRYTPFPPHRHSYVEMLIVLSGSITHMINGEEVVQRAGELLLMNKHIEHSLLTAAKDDVGVNVIMADGFIASVERDLLGTVFSKLLKENDKKEGEGLYLHFTSGGKRQIDNLIENLLTELAEGEASAAITERTVSLLLYYLSEGAEQLLLGGSAPENEKDKRMDMVLSYVAANYKTATLKELSEKLFLSVPYLSKLIKDNLGKSFSELLLTERIERAKKLFLTLQMPVGEVIRAVGYENESYFHREFKRLVGMTPLTYRKCGGIKNEPAVLTNSSKNV